jgi:hypothetical protein
MHKHQQTRIEDLAALGYELSEAHLRLAAGGLALGGSGGRTNQVAPTYRGHEVIDTCAD